jgi:exonuclease III
MWNIHGLGKLARIRQLKEMIMRERIDIVGVQEIIKQDFTDRELQILNQGGDFYWNCLPATGHS